MSRILYLIIFYLIYSVTDIALMVIAIIQTLLNLFTGEPSDTLRNAGGSLAIYAKQIIEYVSYASDHKPYPFSDWPVVVKEENLQELER